LRRLSNESRRNKRPHKPLKARPAPTPDDDTMRTLLLLALSFMGASALMVSPLAAPAHASRVVIGPAMACNGGKGGSGGMAPKKDKERRGKLRRLIQVADSAENVKAVLLSSQTESLVLKMNWKLRKFAQKKIAKRAAQFDVEVPAAFAGFDVKKENTKKSLLKPSLTERSPAHPGAVAALAKLRSA